MTLSGDLTNKTAIAIGINLLFTWRSGMFAKYPRICRPELVSPILFTATQFATYRAHLSLFVDPPVHLQLDNYQSNKRNRRHTISIAVASIAAIILTPQFSKRYGHALSTRASTFIAIPSLALGYGVRSNRDWDKPLF